MKIKVNEEDLKKFNESDIGKVKNRYLKRSTIIGITLISFGLVSLIIDIFKQHAVYEYIISSLIVLFGFYFVINSIIIKRKEVNKFIYEQKKKTSK